MGYNDTLQSVFAYGLSGSTWTAERQINPGPDPGNSDNAVSCRSCPTPVRRSDPSPIVQQFALAEYWNGSTWVRQTSPAPDGRPDTTLTGVSCVGGTSCVAVGAGARVNQMNGHSGRYRAMGEVWDGSSWSLSPVVGLAGAVLTLSAVSCRSPTACIAVGGSSTGTAESTIVEAYTG